MRLRANVHVEKNRGKQYLSYWRVSVKRVIRDPKLKLGENEKGASGEELHSASDGSLVRELDFRIELSHEK